MSEVTRALLKKLLVSRYAFLVKRLERITGSKDGAADALHETWVRLETVTVPGSVANADAYILGMASNVVVDQYRRDLRHVHEDEFEALFEVPDELADPERIVSARRELESLRDILRGLTPRRRAILIAARVDGQLNREIAERYGVSMRTVEKELSQAMKYCLKHTKMAEEYKSITSGRRKF